MAFIKAILNFIRRWFLHLFAGRSLQAKRRRYRFATAPALPDLHVQNGTPDIPFEELPSIEWLFKVADALFRTSARSLLQGTGPAAAAVQGTGPLATDQRTVLAQVTDAVDQLIAEHDMSEATPRFPQGLTDYNALFSPNTIPLPDVARYFQPKPGNAGWFEDSLFGNLRTAGFNPMVLQGVSKIPEAFAGMSQETYQTAAGAGFGGDSLERAAADGRLYWCDYRPLQRLIDSPPPNAGGTFPNSTQKYLYAPQALFVVPPTASATQPADLQPLAIQLTRDGRAFYPNDPGDTFEGLAWTQAKYALNSIDGTYHEVISHLGWTHLVIEPVAVCTQRNLRERHEIYQLLVPHLEGTIFINNAAAGKLINSGGEINKLLAAKIKAIQEFAVEARGVNADGMFDFNQQFVPIELARRNVLAKNLNFPYRDDAMRLWETIAAWVSDYIDIFYASDQQVSSDVELQNWASELISQGPQGGQLQDFGDPAAGDKLINTKSYLKDALTMIIFTSSAQHAAVNFPQAKIMTYAPVVPLALYTPEPTGAPSTVDTYSPDGSTPSLLPPLSIAKLQVDLASLLGGVYYTQLGNYRPGHFRNSQVLRALARFQNNLVGIEQQILSANRTRTLSYPYLLPSQIPQSINI